MFEEFEQTARAIFESAQARGALIRNPDEARLRAMALEEPEVRETRYGSLVADSEPMSGPPSSPRTTLTRRSASPSTTCWKRPSAG